MTVSRLYHLGSDITIKFRIEGSDEDTFTVSARVFDSQGNMITDELHPEVIGRTVELTVPEEVISDFGDYVALFKIAVSGQKPKDLPIYFAVASKEAAEQTKHLPVGSLNKESADNALESAVAETLRALRRHMDAEEALRQTMNAARIQTERDLIPRDLLRQEVKEALSKFKVVVTV